MAELQPYKDFAKFSQNEKIDSSSFMHPQDHVYFASFSKYAWSEINKLKLGI